MVQNYEIDVPAAIGKENKPLAQRGYDLQVKLTETVIV